MAPLTRFRAIKEGGVFGPNTKIYYRQRASKGGLLIAEATPISASGAGFDFIPGIYTQAQIESWKEVTNEVKKADGFIYLQLWHMGRTSHSFRQPDGLPGFSASAVADPEVTVAGVKNAPIPMEVPRAMTVDDINQTLKDYHQAAVNSKNAGFHGVEIHSANGYLLQQFLSSNVNLRTDSYGGSDENRSRFVIEVLNATIRGWLDIPITASDEQVRNAVSEQYGSATAAIDVGIRLSPNSTFGGIREDDYESLYSYLISQFNLLPAQLAYVHIVEPRVAGNNDVEFDTKAFKHYSFSEKLGRLFKGCVISAGGYSTDPYSGTETIESGAADLIAVGRSFISNPDLVYRLENKIDFRPYDRSTFYIPDDVKGYIDYPTYEEEQQQKAQARASCCF